MHWDHEPVLGCRGAAVSAVFAGVSPAMDRESSRLNGGRDTRPTSRRLMESSSLAFNVSK